VRFAVASTEVYRCRDGRREPDPRKDLHMPHTKPGLAQSAKDLPSINPIVDELGTNRGS
jgi:hypothetical protein